VPHRGELAVSEQSLWRVRVGPHLRPAAYAVRGADPPQDDRVGVRIRRQLRLLRQQRSCGTA
jgi:hypothetical protein